MAYVFSPPDPIIDLCWDPVFKSIFTRDTEPSRGALRGLLSAILEQEVGGVSITANEPPASQMTDRQIRYDVNCVLESGEKANVEMTLFPTAEDVLRMEYYLARLFTSQDIHGEGRSYRDLVRCFQVSLLANRNLFADGHFCHRFEYYDSGHGIGLGGRTAVVTLELRKLEALAGRPVGGMSGKERWGLFLRYYADPARRALMEAVLEAEEGIRMANAVIHKFSRKELELFHEISKEKYRLDMNAHRNEARDEGLAEGRAEGRAEGLAKGLAEGRAEGYGEAKQEFEAQIRQLEEEVRRLRGQ